LLVTVTDPLSFPAAVGLKMTLNVRLCVAVSVTGVPAPLKLNPVPLAVIAEMVTSEFPVLVTVTVLVEDDPVFTVPKPRLVLLNEIVCVELSPLPLNPIVAGLPGALLTTEMLPVADPAAVGANCVLKVDDCPGFRESGSAIVPRLNPAPVTLTWLMVRAAVPVLLS
jgi:hypothetical protein